MRYLPHTPDDIKAMLGTIGVGSIDDLFNGIPADSRRERPLDLPGPLTEWELAARVEKMAASAGGDWSVFVGAGSQPHYTPSLVQNLAGRQEFLTSYTPYQPEMSQGTLQAIFEFQTLISRLTGLPVTNASMYDGATAMAEAALMAQRITKRKVMAVSSLVHPHWRQVLKTYMDPHQDVQIVELPADANGRTNFSALPENPAVLLMQSPNFWGVIEDLGAAATAVHAAGGLLATGFSEAFALGLIKNPGEQGADLVFGDAQSLGQGQGFGGPGLGLISTKMEHVRQIPGRLIGRTTDKDGKDGFVLTLSTREQHIRRSKAVSNICSNAGHAALTAAIFMATVGGTGFRQIAQINHSLAEYLKGELGKIGWKPLGAAPTFNEFVMIAPGDFTARHEALKARKILAGLPLSTWYPDLKNAWLFGATETKSRADIDALIAEVK